MHPVSAPRTTHFELQPLPTRQGHTLYVPKGLVHSQQREITATGEYEPEATAAVFRCARPGMRVLDCGANCGYHTLNLAKAVGPEGRVLAVEVNPELIEVLAFNARENGYSERVEIINCGVWKEDTTLRFPLRKDSLAGASFKKKQFTFSKWKARFKIKQWVEAEVRTLESLCHDRHIDLIRMDIEGAEYEAITGSHEFLTASNIPLIMEWQARNSSRAETEGLYETLRGAGYWVYRITSDGLLRVDSGIELFEKHRELQAEGQRDVLCDKQDLGPRAPL